MCLETFLHVSKEFVCEIFKYSVIRLCPHFQATWEYIGPIRLLAHFFWVLMLIRVYYCSNNFYSGIIEIWISVNAWLSNNLSSSNTCKNFLKIEYDSQWHKKMAWSDKISLAYRYDGNVILYFSFSFVHEIFRTFPWCLLLVLERKEAPSFSFLRCLQKV